MTENNEDLGTLFIDARVKKGLTQEDVSKTLKVRISAVKQMERIEQIQSLGPAYNGMLKKLCKLVDLEPDNIIRIYKSSNDEENAILIIFPRYY